VARNPLFSITLYKIFFSGESIEKTQKVANLTIFAKKWPILWIFVFFEALLMKPLIFLIIGG
jgi:hypothetical protein